MLSMVLFINRRIVEIRPSSASLFSSAWGTTSAFETSVSTSQGNGIRRRKVAIYLRVPHIRRVSIVLTWYAMHHLRLSHLWCSRVRIHHRRASRSEARRAWIRTWSSSVEVGWHVLHTSSVRWAEILLWRVSQVRIVLASETSATTAWLHLITSSSRT